VRQAPPEHAAFIYNLGVADFAGFRIAVDSSGKAWAIDGGGKTSGVLDTDVVRRFFNDLSAAGPLQKLPEQRCASAQPGIQFTTNVTAPLIVTWEGQSSPDLSCASDPRAQNLRFDAAVIAHALAVQSYRVRTTALGGKAGSQQYSSGGSTSQNSYFSGYAFNGNGFSNTSSAASYNMSSGSFDAGRFSNEPFRNDAFSGGGRFSDTGFSTERFSNDVFNNGIFGSSDFRSETFNSGFSINFGNGNFSSGGFGSGNFTTPSYTNGGFSGGGFGGGTFTSYPIP
jgi:hypothetical protein